MVRKKSTMIISMLLFFGVFPVWGALPNFHLTEIRIEGMREDVEGIVLAESRLKPDRAYSEKALFEAMVRLRRLPFVLEAEFFLEKGPEIQTYALVIVIQPTKRLFFNAETTFFHRRNSKNNGIDGQEHYSRDEVSLGVRFFPSSNSQFYTALNPSFQYSDVDQEAPLTVTAGFAHYDLGGPGHFFNIEAFYSEGENRIGTFFDGSPRVTDGEFAGLDLLYAIPVRVNQWLRFGGGGRRSEVNFQSLQFIRDPPSTQRLSRLNERDLKYLWVDWERNTINDHTLPTSGHRLRGGLAYIQDRIDFSFPQMSQEQFIDNEEEIAAFFVYEHYWRVSTKQTVFLQTVSRVGYEQFKSQNRSIFGGPFVEGEVRNGSQVDVRLGIESGYSLDLVTPPRISWAGDLRLEIKLSSAIEQEAFDPISGENRIKETEGDIQNLSVGMIFRNIWGVVRLAVSYGWD